MVAFGEVYQRECPTVQELIRESVNYSSNLPSNIHALDHARLAAVLDAANGSDLFKFESRISLNILEFLDVLTLSHFSITCRSAYQQTANKQVWLWILQKALSGQLTSSMIESFKWRSLRYMASKLCAPGTNGNVLDICENCRMRFYSNGRRCPCIVRRVRIPLHIASFSSAEIGDTSVAEHGNFSDFRERLARRFVLKVSALDEIESDSLEDVDFLFVDTTAMARDMDNVEFDRIMAYVRNGGTAYMNLFSNWSRSPSPFANVGKLAQRIGFAITPMAVFENRKVYYLLDENMTRFELNVAYGTQKKFYNMGETRAAAEYPIEECRACLTKPLIINDNIYGQPGGLRLLHSSPTTGLGKIYVASNMHFMANKTAWHGGLLDHNLPLVLNMSANAAVALPLRKQLLLALETNKKSSWNRSRLMFVGQGRAGKTSTESFQKTLDSTIGADVLEGKISGEYWKNNPLHIGNGNTSMFLGQLQLNNIVENIKANTTVGVKQKRNMITATKKNVSNKLSSIKTLLKSKSKTNNINVRKKENGSGEFVNETEAIMPDEVEQLFDDSTEIKDVELNFEDFSHAKNKKEFDVNLSIWDFGGQDVFYAIHHIFLTKSGVYILVVDVRELLDTEKADNAVEYLLFWLRSIKLHAPNASLIIAGTFSSGLVFQEGVQQVNKTLLTLIETSFPQVVSNEEMNLCFFPIDNRDGLGFGPFRSAIKSSVEKDGSVSELVSIRWMAFLDKLLARKQKESHMSLSDAIMYAHTIGITDVAELDMALQLFHERGMLVRFTATAVLRNTIIIKPQWLVDILGKVIRDRNVHIVDVGNDDVANYYNKKEFEKVGLLDDLRMTFQDALTTRDFLEYVWKEELEKVDFIIDLMKRTMLLSEWKYTRNGESMYLIPSLLQKSASVTDFTVENSRAIFDFSNGFLPNGVFQRLICLCVEHGSKQYTKYRSSLREPVIFKHYGSVEFEPGFILNLHQENQYINIYVTDDRFAAKGLEIVQGMLQKINHDVMDTGLLWETYVQDKKTQLVPYKQALDNKISPWFHDQDSNTILQVKDIDLETFLENL